MPTSHLRSFSTSSCLLVLTFWICQTYAVATEAAIAIAVQGNLRELTKWIAMVSAMEHKDQVTLFALSYEQPLEAASCTTNSVCMFQPNSTWTSGRNALAHRIANYETDHNLRFKYWMFGDGDSVDMDACDKAGRCSAPQYAPNSEALAACCFDATLEILSAPEVQYAEVSFYLVTIRGVDYPSFAHIDCADPRLVAFHRTAVPVMLPYVELLDKTSWWMSQKIHFHVVKGCFPGYSVYSNHMDADFNEGHSSYPRGLASDKIIQKTLEHVYGGLMPVPISAKVLVIKGGNCANLNYTQLRLHNSYEQKIVAKATLSGNVTVLPKTLWASDSWQNSSSFGACKALLTPRYQAFVHGTPLDNLDGSPYERDDSEEAEGKFNLARYFQKEKEREREREKKMRANGSPKVQPKPTQTDSSPNLPKTNYNNLVHRMTTGNMNKVYMSDKFMVPSPDRNHPLPVSLRDLHFRSQYLENVYLLWVISVGHKTPKTLDNGVCYLQIPKTGSSGTKALIGNYRHTTPNDNCTFVFATIREDPLERFISGWGTVSHRLEGLSHKNWNEDINDAISKISAWLAATENNKPFILDPKTWAHLLPQHFFLSLVPPQTTLVLGNVSSIEGRLLSFEKGLDITYIEHVNRNEGGLDRSNISFSPDVLEKLTDYCALDTLLIKTHNKDCAYINDDRSYCEPTMIVPINDGSGCTPCTTAPLRKAVTFIHVPKTGGESMESVLKQGWKNHFLAYDYCKATERSAPKLHSKESKLNMLNSNLNWRGNCTSPLKNAKDNIWISTVRNPFDRMFSWFNFCIHGYWLRKAKVWGIPAPQTEAGCYYILTKLQNDKIISENAMYWDSYSQSMKMRGLNENPVDKNLDSNAAETTDLMPINDTYVKEVFESWLVETRKWNHFWVWGSYYDWYHDPKTGTMLIDKIFRFESIYNKSTSAIGNANCPTAIQQELCRAGIISPAELTTPHVHMNDDSELGFGHTQRVLQYFKSEPQLGYKRWYSQASRDMVAAHFKFDLETYGYTFD